MKKIIQNERGGAGLIVVLIIAAGIIAFLMLRQPSTEQLPEETAPVISEEDTAISEEDTTAVIEKELQATDLGNLETDINSLEADINQL